jgi:cephalosporin hydroxylase
MSAYESFKRECRAEIAAQGADGELKAATKVWMDQANEAKYSYHFEWLGRPIIQFPQDIVGVQELIWQVRPDVVIETGIAHGGSLVLSASMLALLDVCDAVAGRAPMDLRAPKRRVVGIDVDIRPHNRAALEGHPMSRWIQMIQGSSIDAGVVASVKGIAAQHERVMVFLDSMHTHEHVLAELNAYAPLVTPESYCVVFDTVIEDMPADSFPDRPWGVGNNPKTAVRQFVRAHPEFVVDAEIENKLLVTVAPEGFLKRVR